jgi:hypothetical protein
LRNVIVFGSPQLMFLFVDLRANDLFLAFRLFDHDVFFLDGFLKFCDLILEL